MVGRQEHAVRTISCNVAELIQKAQAGDGKWISDV